MYRIRPDIFVPDGAAIRDRGPDHESLTAGLRIQIPFGWLDLALERRRMKYYDSYFSNTNFVNGSLVSFMFNMMFGWGVH